MTTGLHFRLITLPLILLSLMSFCAFAEDSEDTYKENEEQESNAPALPEVVISDKHRYPELQHSSSAAGTVLLREDFDDAAEKLPEVLDKQAGVRVTQMGGPGSFSTLAIRGSTSDQVLVIVDGIPINAASGGPVDLSRLPLGNIARIEIYRGMAPVVYGANAIGGVVAITTRNGNSSEISLGAGGGSYGAREARLFTGIPQPTWDMALGLDYSGWEGSFAYENDNGTLFDKSDDREVVRENNHFDQVNLLTKGRLHLNENWRLTIADWFFFRKQGVAGLGQFETRSASYNSLDNLTAFKLDAFDLFGRLEWHSTAAFRFSYSKFRDPDNEIGLGGDDVNDRTYSPSIDSWARIAIFDWWKLTAQSGYNYESYQPSKTSLSASGSNRHNIGAGLESDFYIEAISTSIIPSGNIKHSKSRLNQTSMATADKNIEHNSDKTEESFRLAIVNESIPDTRLSISGGRGLRLPSLFELFGNTGKVIGNPALKSESSYNFDGGLIYDSTMLPQPYRLRVEIFGFYSLTDNLIQFVQTSQNVSVAENIDRAEIWGIESGLRADLFGHLRLSGNYTYMRTENTGSIAARKGNRLPHRPASKWYARAEGYHNNIPELKELGIYIESEWSAGNYLDNANLVSVASRFLLNSGFAIEMAEGRAKLTFAANNLTNEQTLDLAGYPMPGRSFNMFFNWKML